MILTLYPAFCLAAAWPQPEGEVQAILSGYYYHNESFFDNQGERRAQPAYSNVTLNPYVEYGLREDLTLGATALLTYARDATGGGNSQMNLGDSEVFARQRLWKNDQAVLSVQPFVKLPSPGTGSNPMIGGKQMDLGSYVSAGYGFKLLGQDHFANLDLGYRHRFGEPSDQIHANATLGIRPDENILLLSQLFVTRRTGDQRFTSFTQSSGDDYDLTTVQLSAVYPLSEELDVQIGGFSNVEGRNVGAGAGVFTAIWARF